MLLTHAGSRQNLSDLFIFLSQKDFLPQIVGSSFQKETKLMKEKNEKWYRFNHL